MRFIERCGTRFLYRQGTNYPNGAPRTLYRGLEVLVIQGIEMRIPPETFKTQEEGEAWLKARSAGR